MFVSGINKKKTEPMCRPYCLRRPYVNTHIMCSVAVFCSLLAYESLIHNVPLLLSLHSGSCIILVLHTEECSCEGSLNVLNHIFGWQGPNTLWQTFPGLIWRGIPHGWHVTEFSTPDDIWYTAVPNVAFIKPFERERERDASSGQC